MRTRNRSPLFRILPLVFPALLFWVVSAPQAEARRLYIGYTTIIQHGFHSCGCPIKVKRIVRGFCRSGYPIYRYHRLTTPHQCVHHRRRYHSPRHFHYDHARHHDRHIYRSDRGHYRRYYQQGRR